jgi:inner membrane protein
LVLGQASLFTLSVTRAPLSDHLCGNFGRVVLLLYVVLSMEAFSLLVGSFALFAALSVVMIVTRHMSWSTAQHPPHATREPAPDVPS